MEEGRAYAEGFNFGPDEKSVFTVGEMARLAVKCYGQGSVRVQRRDNLHEATLLTLDITKARKRLGWIPTYTATQAVAAAVEWYKRFYAGEEMLPFTEEQIKNFEGSLAWKKN